VPSGRLSRLARFGGLASGIAGTMLADGARQLSRGKRPTVGDLLMTPTNAIRVTEQLAQLRGAAMKVGQLLSMDAGEMLPPELADILARLRSDARHMPEVQLRAALNRRWGRGWEERFETFDFIPIAAASIGQVHRARTIDGRDLAIKVQYPGVRDSIDSDVDNIATLMRVSGVVPKTLDVTAILAEAKRQLHEEADYEREGRYLARFGALLSEASDFRVPELYADLTRPTVLAMSHVAGVPIETLIDRPQEDRDRVVGLLIQLLLRELFEFGVMQTDPNFANYLYDPNAGRIVLLDFGAARDLPPAIVEGYRRLLKAGIDADREAARQAALDIGFFAADADANNQAQAMDLFELAMEPLHRPGPFDFSETGLTMPLRERGLMLAQDRSFWHVPPIDTLFLQRKFGGIYLLASRLKARVDVRALLAPYL
jgi:predicted unusual protein kinase regulating ubiquinone biosynthesis (AarF/ABC1/UbiB family)